MTGHRVPRSLMHGSRKWKHMMMYRWAHEIGRDMGKKARRLPKGWHSTAIDGLEWIPRYYENYWQRRPR